MMLNGACVPCPAGCAQCSATRLGACTSCLPAYYYSSTNQTCVLCSQANCITCTAMACLACAPNYFVSPSLGCQRKCVSPCATCSETSSSDCLSCVAGFTFNSSSLQNCQPNLTCNNNGSCSMCPFGYSMLVSSNYATCVKCNGNCQRCNSQDGNSNICLGCYDGLFLNGTICSACSSFCTICTGVSSCFQCALGFVAQQAASVPTSSINTNVGASSVVYQPLTCLACTSNCATCYNTPSTCLSCNANFMLSGTTCLGQFAIDLTVTFAPSNNDYSFFNDNYNSIMSGLASAAGVAPAAINVKSIVYNSVILNAAVTSTNQPNSNAAKSMQASINNYFSGLNIVNLQVANSVVTNPG